MFGISFLLQACVEAQRPKQDAVDSAVDSASDTDSAAPCTESDWYFDADEDGFGSEAAKVSECEQPAGYVATGNDCDDTDAAVHPDAEEDCEASTDLDCDGDGVLGATDVASWYADADGDAFGDAATIETGCSQPSGYVADATDCDDHDQNVHPGADEYCDTTDSDCDTSLDDGDEINALTWYADIDGDTFGDAAVSAVGCDAPEGHVADDTDCDDAMTEVHPGADEHCDGVDEDCDGNGDAGAVDPITWYLDVDGDGYGTSALTYAGCSPLSGYVAEPTDCDDTTTATSPVAVDACDGIDHDCDGVVDEDDSAAAPTWYRDADGDGHGDASVTKAACSLPEGHVEDASDCDDGDADVSPSADEYCGGGDEDCDGEVDEDAALDALTWYADADGDGYGDPDSTRAACVEPSGYLADASDCDDSDADSSPDGTDTCSDALDQDCDGDADDGCWPVGDVPLADARGVIYGTEASLSMGLDSEVGDVTGDGVVDWVSLVYRGSRWDVFVLDLSVTSVTSAPGGGVLASRTGVYGAFYPCVGDLDDDGIADVIASSAASGTTGVEYGPITGSAAWSADWSTVLVNSADPAIGDLDADGDDDIASGDGTDIYVVGDGGVEQSRVREYGTSFVYFGVTLASGEDLDGDGNDDLAAGAAYGEEGLWVFHGPLPSNLLSSSADVIFSVDGTDDPNFGGYLLEVSPDLDGDGYGELITSNNYEYSAASALYGRAYVFPGSLSGTADVGDATTTITADAEMSGPAYAATTADVDGDSQRDLILGDWSSDGGVGVFLAPFTGTLVGADADTLIEAPGTGVGSARGGVFNAGDLDGLGYDAIAFGDPYGDTYATDAGAVYVFYGP